MASECPCLCCCPCALPLSLLLPVAAHCQLHAELEKLSNTSAALENVKRTLVKQAEMSGGLVDAMITSTTKPDLGMEQVRSVTLPKQLLLAILYLVSTYCLCVCRSRCGVAITTAVWSSKCGPGPTARLPEGLSNAAQLCRCSWLY